MLNYSYSVFSQDEIDQINILNEDKVLALDNIDIRKADVDIKKNLYNYYIGHWKDHLDKEGEPYPILFKDIAVIDKGLSNFGEFDSYWTYHVYDRTSETEDERVLECSLYTDTGTKWSNGEFIRTLSRTITFKIKVQHIPQFFFNISKDYINYKINKKINKFVVPVYLCPYVSDKKYIHFARFSEYYDKSDYDEIASALKYMMESIKLFIFMNTFVWCHLNSAADYRTMIYDGQDRLLNVQPLNIHKLAAKARSNKKLVVSLDFANKIDLTLHPRRKNMYIDASRQPARFCDYKFQVIGHYQHYWVGHGKNKTRVLKYIDPYYKNKDKEFKIIKEYQSEENAPRD